MNRPPAPIIAAVALLTLMTVASAAAVIYAVTEIGPGVLIGLIFPLLTAFAALGLWQGTRGSRVITIALSLLLVLSGLNGTDTAVIGIGTPILGVILFLLLIAPRASREWFTRPDSGE